MNTPATIPIQFRERFEIEGRQYGFVEAYDGQSIGPGFISTSQDIEIAEGFAGKNGYVYEIETSQGINANETLGAASPFPEQKEVSIPREIPPSDIKGAYPVKGGKMTGEFIPNPNFGGG